MTTFKELGLNPETIKSLDDLGFIEPSPVQEKAIPFILKSKKDLIALAQTGTGKTAAYALPILNKIKPGERDLQAIVICPTRELCLQISQDIRDIAKYSRGVTVTSVYGGERIDIQIRALKGGTNIVVGTPGRVHDLIRRHVLKLQSIKWLVLDEADEMLDMGFKNDLDAILSQTPGDRRTLLFSATMSGSVRSIAKQYMGDAEEISIGARNIGAEKVDHEYYIAGARDRFEALKRILDHLPGVYGILFCRTRRETQEVADKLRQANYDTEALHGEISQTMRTKIMARFKKKQIRLLVATDVAARGIDVNDLSHVINYNLPDQNQTYIHRSGRTGRVQKSGISILIVSPREVGRIRKLEGIIGKKFEHKKIPSGEEVCLKQIDSFLEEVKGEDFKKIGDERYFQEFAERLDKISKEDLIKYLIVYKFSHLMDSYKNARDLNDRPSASSERRGGGGRDRSRAGSRDSVSLKINCGRKQGIDIRGFLSFINSNRDLKGIDIGRIDLSSDHLVFSVEKERADEVMRHLKGISLRGRKIDVSTGYAGTSYKGDKRGGQNKGFRRKKGGFNKRVR